MTPVLRFIRIPLYRWLFASHAKTRRRVLPVEILPYKLYSLPVIETACKHYTISTDGLRNSVKKIPGIAPHYSALHGWIGGIGERALDRVQLRNDRATTGKPSLPLTSSLIAETAQKKDPYLINHWNKTSLLIPEWKYKSPFRKEMIESSFRLLSIALLLFKDGLYPLTQWQGFLITVFNVPCWLFSSRNILTAIQLTDSIDNMIISVPADQRGPP